jgi:hypothetical protein
MSEPIRRRAIAAVGFAAALAAGNGYGADPARGRALYEARCGGCHNESVHSDASRKARNFDEARRRVADFALQLKTGWQPGELDDVTVYLNERYYAFPCPPSVCPAKPPAAGPR